MINDLVRMNRTFFSALRLEKLAMSIAIGLIILVAALNIVSVLVLMVMEKVRDIGVLSAMGATSAGIRKIFLLQGLIIASIGTLVGAGLGFLWFNTYPAQVFMGDVGALALGAALGVVAVIVRHEIVLFIMGGLFVLETVSVILQVASFKLTGKRIFRMAPIHHHFELKGWPEPRVIVRFWIIAIALALLAMSTLKLR